MADEYKEMIKRAWKMLDIPQYDSRDFLTAISDLIAERDRLKEENEQYKERIIRAYNYED